MQHYEILNETEYENRFKQWYEMMSSPNYIGYGTTKKYIPPLQHPETIAEGIERHVLLLYSFGYLVELIQYI